MDPKLQAILARRRAAADDSGQDDAEKPSVVRPAVNDAAKAEGSEAPTSVHQVRI